MNKIEHFEIYIDEQISTMEQQLAVFKQIKMCLSEPILKTGKTDDSEIKNPELEQVQAGESTFRKELYKDYPFNGRFSEKIKYLDSIHPKAWSYKERDALIRKIETEEMANKTLLNLSQRLKHLVYDGELIVAKFGNSNRHAFYVRQEWLTDDEQPVIKPEHSPDPEAFGKMPMEKRTADKIQWIKTKK